MPKTFLVIVVLFFVTPARCQDTLLTYSHILQVDTLSKNEIFDRTLIWCSKAFKDSKSAINVKEREGGIIGGKAYYQSPYKVPKKKDSTLGLVFNNYYFDWLIEIKDNKLRFTASNIILKELDKDFIVTTTKIAPFEVWLQPKSKTELQWKLSKEYFVKNLDELLFSLRSDLVAKKADW